MQPKKILVDDFQVDWYRFMYVFIYVLTQTHLMNARMYLSDGSLHLMCSDTSGQHLVDLQVESSKKLSSISKSIHNLSTDMIQT